jgi:hypothetical protein
MKTRKTLKLACAPLYYFWQGDPMFCSISLDLDLLFDGFQRSWPLRAGRGWGRPPSA